MTTDPLLIPVLIAIALVLYGLGLVVGAVWDCIDRETQNRILDNILGRN